MRNKKHQNEFTKRKGSIHSSGTCTASKSETAPSLAFATKAQIAKGVRVSTKTIETWVRERRIPAYKVGRTIRFKLDEVEAALRAFRTDSVACN